MLCKKCGYELKEGSLFCSKCGASVKVFTDNSTASSGSAINPSSLESESSSYEASGNKLSLIKKIIIRAKRNPLVVVISGVLMAFFILQIYLANITTPEMKSQESFIELSNGVIIDREDWETGNIPESVSSDPALLADLDEKIVDAKWGYHALTSEQIDNRRGWDLPQDMWKSLSTLTPYSSSSVAQR